MYVLLLRLWTKIYLWIFQIPRSSRLFPGSLLLLLQDHTPFTTHTNMYITMIHAHVLIGHLFNLSTFTEKKQKKKTFLKELFI